MSCRQRLQKWWPQGMWARRALSRHTLHSSSSSLDGIVRLRTKSEWRCSVNELKELGVKTQTTYATARLKGSLDGTSLSDWPQRQMALARRSLGMASHALYGHGSGRPQSTTSVRVCRDSMILPLSRLKDGTRILQMRPANWSALWISMNLKRIIAR
jgi:hypothetical protein